jgi:hypothetical protein
MDLRRRFDITLEDYEQMLLAQQGKCAVCLRSAGEIGTGANSSGTLAVDHDQRTGAIRGLLCTNCNLGIGSFFDRPATLRLAALYLERHEAALETMKEIANELKSSLKRLKK